MTNESVFSAVLTLGLLAGGAVVFGSEFEQSSRAPAKAAATTLPAVTVVGRRIAAAEVTLPTVTVVGDRAALATVTLPTVTVVGRRTPTAVAVEMDNVDRHVQ